MQQDGFEGCQTVVSQLGGGATFSCMLGTTQEKALKPHDLGEGVAVAYHLIGGNDDDSQAVSKDRTCKAGILSDFKCGVLERLLAASIVILNRTF